VSREDVTIPEVVVRGDMIHLSFSAKKRKSFTGDAELT
jgi:hypothetical protein